MLFLSSTILTSQLSGFQAEIACCAKALRGKSPTCEGYEGFLYDFPGGQLANSRKELVLESS